MNVKSTLLTTADTDDWRRILPSSRSVYGSLEFARIYEQQAGYSARLLVIESGSGLIAYPFFLRPIEQLPFLNASNDTWDSVTPDYTGPFIVQPAEGFEGGHLESIITEVFQQEGIVAEFMHLHPWWDGNNLLDPSRKRYNRDIVWVDLTLGLDELWTEQFNHACRKNINRSRRENIRVFEAQNMGRHLRISQNLHWYDGSHQCIQPILLSAGILHLYLRRNGK